ncbi:MAG TPA: 50S ribosomal protein L27 [Candidatus Paceibacterota bacterium]|nr:50S ribosomal protein L27 [Candidatus Paceibacterota bacterium]
MAHRKAGGTAKNLRDSNAQYLGVKLYAGEKARPGAIIIRQRGTKILPGTGVGLGSDHTIFALKEGIVKFGEKRHTNFNGKRVIKKTVNVV